MAGSIGDVASQMSLGGALIFRGEHGRLTDMERGRQACESKEHRKLSIPANSKS